MDKLHYAIVLPLVITCHLVMAGEVMEERKKKAQENIEAEIRADKTIEEEQAGMDSDWEPPYERIDPKSQKSMFKEMKSDETKNTHPAL